MRRQQMPRNHQRSLINAVVAQQDRVLHCRPETLQFNRKLDSAGAGPGLQNRSAALMLSRVGSTPISFRQLTCWLQMA